MPLNALAEDQIFSDDQVFRLKVGRLLLSAIVFISYTTCLAYVLKQVNYKFDG